MFYITPRRLVRTLVVFLSLSLRFPWLSKQKLDKTTVGKGRGGVSYQAFNLVLVSPSKHTRICLLLLNLTWRIKKHGGGGGNSSVCFSKLVFFLLECR